MLFVDNIEHTKETTVVTTKGTLRLHSVWSTAHPLKTECKNVTCLCNSCLGKEDTQCPNLEYVEEFKLFDLTTGTASHDHNLHWPKKTLSASTTELSNGKIQVPEIGSDSK